jgi:hypothetical protein
MWLFKRLVANDIFIIRIFRIDLDKIGLVNHKAQIAFNS